MSNPEIQLPRRSSSKDDDSVTTPQSPKLEKDDIDDGHKHARPGSADKVVEGCDEQTPIIWKYLTYETHLPTPAYLFDSSLSLQNSKSPPQCPDLKKYCSPLQWSAKRKSFITWLSCAATVITAYTAGSYSSGTEKMAREWHKSDVAITVGVTIFTCGFAVAPMFLAPFSEINGRRPVFVATGILFVVFQLCCAVTPTYGGMLISRFLAGCASSTFSTMVGGVVSDIYEAEDRNAAMSLFSGAALFGTGLGPLVSGVIAQHTTWRWIFYLQVITCGVMMGLIVIFFKETRGSVLISQKAKKLNQWYEQLEQNGCYGVVLPSGTPEHREKTPATQRIRWKVQSDEERAALGQMLKISLYRPFYLLFTEPVVFFFSLWISFSWSVLYLTFAAVPLVFETSHGFNVEQSGAVFAAISVAAIVSTIISIYQEKLARRYLVKQRDMLNTPEGRLYFSCIQSALLPIGCFWFGWTSFPNIPWIVPTLAVGCATMGIFSIYLAVFNYLADTYHRYASSALAAQSFCRNMMGGAFPLFTRQMFTKMTFQGAGSFLGGFAALLTLVPWILVFFGARIRARSKFASEIMNGDR